MVYREAEKAMKFDHQVCALLAIALLAAVACAQPNAFGQDAESTQTPRAVPESPAPQPQADVPHMLDVTWSTGKPMPQGMQDNQVALLGNWLVSVGGFCGGYDDGWKPGKYPRGFLNKAWGLDLAHEDKGWQDLPPLPGAPRQAMQGTRVNEALYVWGGFSYTEPYTYKDGYRLSWKGDAWTWEELPPLPSPSAWGGACAIGSKIYTLGGADYDSERFYVLTDRTGEVKRMGARLIVLDTEHLDAGWQTVTPCPGTPRCLTATCAVDGKICFIGGVTVTADAGAFCNVVDSWRYDPAADTWERLRDLPMSGSGACSNLILFKGRYVLLPCGYQYDSLMKPDGTVAPKYGEPSKVTRTWKNHPKLEGTAYFNHFYVYDTRTNLYGTATALPFDDVASITVVVDDTAYMFPGETAGFVWEGEYFGHHPEFVLEGKLKEHPWE